MAQFPENFQDHETEGDTSMDNEGKNKQPNLVQTINLCMNLIINYSWNKSLKQFNMPHVTQVMKQIAKCGKDFGKGIYTA